MTIRSARACGFAFALALALPVETLSAPCGPVPRDDTAAARPDEFAVSPYQSRSEEARRKLQWALIWVGQYSGEVDGIIGPGTIQAIRRFQASVGGFPTGSLTHVEEQSLYRLADLKKEAAGFSVTRDQHTDSLIGIPRKYVDFARRMENGSLFQSSDGQFKVQTLRIRDGRSFCDLYDRITGLPGRQVTYSLSRDGWFIVKGIEGNRGFFMNAHEGRPADGTDPEIRALSVSYPEFQSAQLLPLVVAMWNAYKPFAPELVARHTPLRDRSDITGSVDQSPQLQDRGRDSGQKPIPTPKPALQLGNRMALVIGNSAYQHQAALDNPRRDAEAVAQALRDVGFRTVRVANDLPRERFVSALREFAAEAEGADWALIYYAGHGMEIGGSNYLIPVDARLKSDRDVQFEAVPLDQVLGAVDGAKKLRLVVLDACRDNPFLKQMTRSMATRSIGGGLAKIEPPAGTLVAYAAKHGQQALEGKRGENSPFAAAFVKHLKTPGLEINMVFRRVRGEVMSLGASLIEAEKKRGNPEAENLTVPEPFVYGALPDTELFFVQK